MINYITAGESHGKALVITVNGIPAGLPLTEDDINRDLSRRQKGYGRGLRMNSIEKDAAEIMSGVRGMETIGSPIAILIRNKDWNQNKNEPPLTAPRPGHADLAGMIKFDREDSRDILERASARETAGRVAAGAVCRTLLKEFDISVISWVVSIGTAALPDNNAARMFDEEKIEQSPVRCPYPPAEKKMMALIDAAQGKGDTLGGVFKITVRGAPPGLGSCMQWDERLSGRLAGALMSIQSVKGVEIGGGFFLSSLYGSRGHDEIFYSKQRGIYRATNRAGGLEGGMTNGEEIVLRAAMKPIATLKKPLDTIDIKTMQSHKATVVRSDICAVPAGGVIGEAVTAVEIAKAFKEKFGGDSLPEMKRNYTSYMNHINKRFKLKK